MNDTDGSDNQIIRGKRNLLTTKELANLIMTRHSQIKGHQTSETTAACEKDSIGMNPNRQPREHEGKKTTKITSFVRSA